jgi:hypothetical protein
MFKAQNIGNRFLQNVSSTEERKYNSFIPLHRNILRTNTVSEGSIKF